RLHFSYQGSGHENGAFLQCYRDGVEQKTRAAANIPQERVTRDSDSPSRITVPAEQAGGGPLLVARRHGTTAPRLYGDSGASWTSLSRAMATELGLVIPVNTRRSVADVAGGRQITMPRIRLASAKVGSVAVENLYIGVYDIFPNSPRVHGVLGIDFLKHFRISFEQGGKRLVLDTQD